MDSIGIMVAGNHKMKMKTELPFSLISAEILSRLPAKSDIGRCRCVCKEWNSYLSTPMFNRTHFQSNVTIDDYKLLLFHSQPPVHVRTIALDQTIPFNPNPDPALSIIASLDGLVCLASKEVTAMLVFWNPFTGAYKRLPSKFNVSATDAIGFYFDDSCHDYKLLCLNRRAAHVYSHKLDSWREIQFPFASNDLSHLTIRPRPTFCGQCLYFTATYITNIFKIDLIRCFSWIICFDVKTEAFRKIQFPHVKPGAGDYSATLGVLNGCLYMCVSYQLAKRVDLWRMDDATNEWVKVAAFSGQQQMPRICTASVGNWLAVLDEDDNAFKKMNMDDFTKHYLAVSDEDDNVSKKMNAEDFTKHYRCFCFASKEYTSSRVIYVETLVSPNP